MIDNTNLIKLNLKRYGWVEGEIVWYKSKLFKIIFFYNEREIVEVFTIDEILNGDGLTESNGHYQILE